MKSLEFIKTLKSTALGDPAKLAYIHKHSTSTFPNKPSIILDWLLQSIFKNAKSPVNIPLDDPIFNVEYWSLFSSLLHAPHSNISPKIPLPPIFISIFSNFTFYLSSSAENIVNLMNDTLPIVSVCFDYLNSDTEIQSRIFRPSWDHHVALCSHICKLFLLITESNNTMNDNDPFSDEILEIMKKTIITCLKNIVEAAAINGNQRKVLTTVCSSLLIPVCQVGMIFENRNDSITIAINELFGAALFNEHHSQEFTNVLVQLYQKKFPSPDTKKSVKCDGYLADMLEKFENDLAVMKCFPVFLTCFIKLQASLPQKPQTSLIPAQSPEFLFFLHLHTIIESYTTLENFNVSLSILNNLLSCLLEFDVYKATSDDISKLIVVRLKEIAKLSVDEFDKEVKKVANCDFQKLVLLLNHWKLMLLLDFDIVDDYIIQIVDLVQLIPLEKMNDHIEQITSFVALLFQTYNKSRMLDVFLNHIMGSWRKLSGDIDIYNNIFYRITKNPSNELSTTISTILPSQILDLLENVANELFEHYPPLIQSKKKKAKLDKPGNKLVESEKNYSLIINLLMTILQSSNLLSTSVQKSRFNKISSRLYNEYITINIENNIQTSLISALELHLLLIEYSIDYWKEFMNKSDSVGFDLVKKIMDISWELDTKCLHFFQTCQVRIALSHADRLVSTSILPDVESEAGEVVKLVLKNIKFKKLKDNPEKIKKRKRDTLKTSIDVVPVIMWEAIVDHLPLISRFASDEYNMIIVDLLIGAFEDKSVGVSNPLLALSETVFQSARFYEIRKIKDVFCGSMLKKIYAQSQILFSFFEVDKKTDKFLQGLLKHFNTETESFSTIQQISIDHIKKIDSSKRSISCTNYTDIMNSVDRLCALLSVLNRMPLEFYLTPTEKDRLMTVFLALDISITALFEKQSKLHASALEIISALKLIGLRLVRSREDKLIILTSTELFQWNRVSLNKCFSMHDSSGLVDEYIKSIKQCSLDLNGIAIRKLCHTISSSSSIEYLSFVFSEVASFLSGSSFKKVNLEIAISIFNPVLQWYHDNLDNNDASFQKTRSLVHDLFNSIQHTISEQFEQQITLLNEEKDTFSNVRSLLDLFNILLQFRSLEKNEYNIFGQEFIRLSRMLKAVSLKISIETVSNDVLRVYSSLFESLCVYGLELIPCLSDSIIIDVLNFMWSLLETNATLGTDDYVIGNLISGFTSLLSKSSQELYQDIVKNLFASLGNFANCCSSTNKTKDITLPVVKFCAAFIEAKNIAGGRVLMKKCIPMLFVKLAQIVQQFASVNTIIVVFDIYTKVISNRFIDIKSEEISIVLQGISLLNSKVYLAKSDVISFEEAELLVDGICRLLLSIVRSPPNATTAALLREEREKKRMSILAPTLPSEDRVIQNEERFPSRKPNVIPTDPFPLLTCYAPFTSKSADVLARVCQSISQKQTLFSYSKNQSLTADNAVSSSGLAMNAMTMKPFAKHVIYILAEYIAIQVSDRPIVSSSVERMCAKDIIVQAMHALMDVCSEKEMDFLLHALGCGNGKGGISGSVGHINCNMKLSMGILSSVGRDAARTLFKQMVAFYKNEKFNG